MLDEYINYKRVEMFVIDSLLVSNSGAEFYTAAEFYDALFEPKIDFVFALSVSLYDVNHVDALTECLSKVSRGTLIDLLFLLQTNQCSKPPTAYKSWADDGSFMTSLRRHAIAFDNFAIANANYLHGTCEGCMHTLAIRETPLGYFPKAHGIRFEVKKNPKIGNKCFAQVFHNGNIINGINKQPLDYEPEFALHMLNLSMKVETLGVNECAESITEWSYTGDFRVLLRQRHFFCYSRQVFEYKTGQIRRLVG